jgi:ketosteroid isomerase-like protein
MKRILTVNMIALLAGAVILKAAAEDEIVKAEKQWATAVVARDFAALEKIYSDDLIYAHSTGVIETKEEYLGKLRAGSQKYDLIDHQKSTIKAFGDSAVSHWIVRMTGNTKGEPFDNTLMMIHFWVKQDGSWRLAAHQTTLLAQ